MEKGTGWAWVHIHYKMKSKQNTLFCLNIMANSILQVGIGTQLTPLGEES